MEQGYTVDKFYENIDIIKKSKFIAMCFNIQSKSQVEKIIADLKIKHKDATHICYAYVLTATEQKFNDDGEPQGTAGMPILNCILKQNLKYVLVVVIRYFGGIKLGAGGLTRAYTNSASAVLKLAQKRKLLSVEKYSILVESNEVNKLERLKQYDIVNDIIFNFDENITATILVLSGERLKLEKLISSTLNKSVTLNFLEEMII